MERSIAQLQALAGQQVGISDWHQIDQSVIDAFADATGDHQHIHTDPAAARASGFDGTIAHGFLTLSLLPAMLDEAVGTILGVRERINYGMDRMRFLAPVPCGARVRASFVLADMVGHRPGQFQLHWDVTVEISGLDRPALVARWINMIVATE